MQGLGVSLVSLLGRSGAMRQNALSVKGIHVLPIGGAERSSWLHLVVNQPRWQHSMPVCGAF